jgi:hypothetical protein
MAKPVDGPRLALYVRLSEEENAIVEKLAVAATNKTGRPVPLTDVVRSLIRKAGERLNR